MTAPRKVDPAKADAAVARAEERLEELRRAAVSFTAGDADDALLQQAALRWVNAYHQASRLAKRLREARR